MRILPAENLRIPGEGSSAQGKPGPKPRPKGVGDGKSVENPMPPTAAIGWGDTGGQAKRAVGKARPSP